MDVHQLGQGEAARVIRGCPSGLLLVPDRPRRREGVVAVAHGVQERWVATPEAAHRRRHRVNGFAVRDVPAAHAATALHQVEIVGGRPLALEQRLDHGAGRIVDEHENVRRLQDRVASHGDARRQPVGIRAFGAADQRSRPGPVVERLQVEPHDQTTPRRGAPDIALHQHEPGRLLHEHAGRQILAHAPVDGANRRLAITAAQPRFGQHQAQRGGTVSHQAFRLFPVFRRRRVLIARDHRPRLQRHLRLRQQERRHMQRDVGIVKFRHWPSVGERGRRVWGRPARWAMVPARGCPRTRFRAGSRYCKRPPKGPTPLAALWTPDGRLG